MNKKLVLASKSPRRKELLELAELEFETFAAEVDETLDETKPLKEELKRLALKKAKEVLKSYPDCVVIGADTTVAVDDVILGKPKNDEDAKEMLRKLSGRRHEVFTSCALCDADHEVAWINAAEVEFYELDDQMIDWYLSTGDHRDKAGAYGIQSKGALLVKGIHGDFYTVMGLPIAEVIRKLEEFEKDETKNEENQ